MSQQDQLERSANHFSSPRAPARVVLLLTCGLGAAGWYIWHEQSDMPAARHAQSFRLAPRSTPLNQLASQSSLSISTRPTTRNSDSGEVLISFKLAQPSPSSPKAIDPGPTLVTLDLNAASPEEAFRALAAAANVQLMVDADNWSGISVVSAITLRAEQKPFWPVFFELCKQANVYPERYYDPAGDNTRIRIDRFNTGRARWPRSDSGPFTVVLSQLTRAVDANLTGSEQMVDSTRIQFVLYAEPKIGARWVVPLADLEEAVDQSGASLLGPGSRSGAGDGNPSRNPWIFDFSTQLRPPQSEGSKLLRLRGQATVVVQTSLEEFAVNDPVAQRSIRKSIDGLDIEFRGLRYSGTQYDAHFTVRDAAPRSLQAAKRFRSQAEGVKLYNDAGQSLPVDGSGASGSADSFDFHVWFRGENVGSKSKLVLTVPVGLREIRVPFEFRDIPLP